jgi:hypothetical protein
MNVTSALEGNVNRIRSVAAAKLGVSKKVQLEVNAGTPRIL